jgi:hypothetical protein
VGSKSKFRLVIGSVLVVIVAIAGLVFARNRAATQTRESYSPIFRPGDFVGTIDNEYFPLIPGTTFVLRGTRNGQTETMMVTNEVRTVLGVTTTVVLDRVVDKNNELVEETYDWFAQDRNGDVWYFGEDSKDYRNGKVISTAGSWEAGRGGAMPGIAMKRKPQSGESWRQEYSKGIAEDMAQVLRTGESVTVPAGTFRNCIKVKEWTRLTPRAIDTKYYCPGAGMVLETTAVGLGKMELINIRHK